MILPQTAVYALRAMVMLARANGRPCRAVDLARECDVPDAYLQKILRRLVEQGLLRSTRGHHGGFILALPPQHIRFLDVLLALGITINDGRCAFGLAACNAEEPCPLHDAWLKLNTALSDWAASTTLTT